MIFEAILGVRGPFFAPMGVEADERMESDFVVLRPFLSSRTGQALLSSGSGALNFADDALLFAQTALTDETPPSRGPVLNDVPCWWAISVVSSPDAASPPARRLTIRCRVEKKNFLRPFPPFNRARSAAIEAVILATRFRLAGFDRAKAEARMDELEEIAEKTGGKRELRAFKLIRASIA
jgi:hypothetical protein